MGGCAGVKAKETDNRNTGGVICASDRFADIRRGAKENAEHRTRHGLPQSRRSR